MAQISFPNYGLFDATYYIQQNPDVAANWTGTPLQHYIQFGAREGRAPTPYFDADFYRATYVDLQSMNALQLFDHYCNYGFNEGRVPMLNFSNFNAARYLADNPDVAAGGYTVTNAVSHFIKYGEYEGRTAYAQNGVVINPVVNEGDLYALTTGVDNFDGTQYNDTFNASLGGANSNTNTLNALDNLDGMGGTDTLNATLASSVTPANLANIEVFNVDSAAAVTLNMVNAGQATNVNDIGSTGLNTLTFTNIAAGAALSVQDAEAGHDTTFEYASTSGTADTAALTVSNVATAASGTGPATVVTVAGIETINLTSSGSVANEFTLTATAATTVNIDGANALTLNGATAATKIDGTNMTAALTATLANAGTLTGGSGNDTLTNKQDTAATINGNAGDDLLVSDHTTNGTEEVSYNGGAGNDVLDFSEGGLVFNTATAGNNDTVDGGTGTADILKALVADLDVTDAPVLQSVFGIEQVSIADGINGTITLSNVQAGITQVNMLDTQTDNASQIVFDSGVASTVTLANNKDLDDNKDLTITAAGSLNTDSTTFSVLGTTANNALNAGGLVFSGYETVTLNTGTQTTMTEQTLDTLDINATTAATNVSLTIAGGNAIDIVADVTSNSTGLLTIDASGLTAQAAGTTTFDIKETKMGAATATVSIIGSGGEDILGESGAALSNYATTVDAGAGNDAIYTGTSADSILGGLGDDTIKSGSGNDTVKGGVGLDVITVGSGSVSIDGGEGNDTITIGSTLDSTDTVDGGADVDTLVVSAAVASPSAGNRVYNVETLSLAVGSNAITQDLSMFGNTTITAATTNSDADISLTNAATALNSLTLTAALSTNDDVSVARLADTTSNALTVNFAAGTSTGPATLNVNNEESLTLTGATASDDATIATLNADQLTSLTFTGAADMVITNKIAGANDSLATITNSLTGAATLSVSAADSTVGITFTAGTSTGTSTVTSGSGADSITAGSGALSVNAGSGIDTITGGAGNDTIAGANGSDVITLGDGVDYASYIATTDGIDTIADFVGGTDKMYFLESAFGSTATWTSHGLVSGAYAETATALNPIAQDLNGGGSTTTGFVVVGASSGTGGVSVYYTLDMGAVTSNNSVLIATLTGLNTGNIAATDFLGN